MFNEIIYKEHNGKVFQLHWKNRYDPVTLAVIAIAGAGVSAYGQYQQGKAAEAQGKQEQMLLEHNAKIKEREAAAELQRSRAEALRFEKEGEALQGTAKVNANKGAVLSQQGSIALSLEQTALELDADRRSILEEGFLNQSFRQSEAAGLRFEGASARAKGKNLKTASKFQAAGTILSGIGAAGKAKA